MTTEQTSQDLRKHVQSATLVMGATGSGKSCLLATLMMYVYERFGLITVLYSTDGGGFPALVQALVRKGICRVWRLPTRGEAFETCYRASQGWLPRRLNPLTGETEPNVQLVPPTTRTYVVRCPQGHPVQTFALEALIHVAKWPQPCPTCQAPVDTMTMRVEPSVARTKGFEAIGAVCFDGLSSMSSWWGLDLGHRSGRMELKGEGSALGGVVQSGDLKFGGTNRAQVGFAQTRAEEVVANSLTIPHLVVPPTFTALVLDTVDEGGLSVRGPKFMGKAKTDEGPGWFGNCLEAVIVKDDRGHDVHRLNLEGYVDQEGIRHLCKHRGAPGTMPAYLEDPWSEDGSLAFSVFSLGKFYELLEAGVERTLSAIDQKYPNLPTVSESMEVGEAIHAPLPPTITSVPKAGAPTVVRKRGAVASLTPVAAPTAAPTALAPPPQSDDGPSPETVPASAVPPAAPSRAPASVASGMPVTGAKPPMPRPPAVAPRPKPKPG